MTRYKKLESVHIRGICVKCNKNPQMGHGPGKFKPLCTHCSDTRYGKPAWKQRYRIFKKDHCEKCGFIPEHPCQLDVDHIDGNHDNNEEKNYQTLCANCHRLKTYEQRYGDR